MNTKNIKPTKVLTGRVALPGDKSISHRAVMIGAISRGETAVKNMLDCDDCNYTIRAFRGMGIDIKNRKGETIITGKGLKGLSRPKAAIDVGNSGTTMRLLAGILAGQGFETTLEGDTSLSNRPMTRIVEPLSKMGLDIKAATGRGIVAVKAAFSRVCKTGLIKIEKLPRPNARPVLRFYKG